VTLSLDARAFAFFDADAKSWLVEPGDFTLRVGQSSADLPLTAQISRTGTMHLPL
jgi:beta-glucosidase